MDSQTLISLIRDERDTMRSDLNVWLAADYRAERPIYELVDKNRERYINCLTVPVKILGLELSPTQQIALYKQVFGRTIRGELNVTTLEATAFSRAVNGSMKMCGKDAVKRVIEELCREPGR